MESWVKDIQYLLMSARHPTKGYEQEYYATYQAWRAAWEKFRNEIGIKEPLTSDAFFQPDEVGSLFYQGECVGLASFTYGQMSQGPMPHLSWFKSWPQEDLMKLQSLSDQMIICSQFTVNPKFAGKGHIVRWKDVVSQYLLLRLVHSNHEIMAGSLNLTRGVDNACGENVGTNVLNPKHVFNYGGIDIPAQLVAFENLRIQAMIRDKRIGEHCDALWSKVIHLSDYPIERNLLQMKQAA